MIKSHAFYKKSMSIFGSDINTDLDTRLQNVKSIEMAEKYIIN